METKSSNCPTMELNNISIEYDFSKPKYTFENIGFQTPRFQATCTIEKNSDIFVCTGDTANTKKQAKHDVSGKMYLLLRRKYGFSDETTPHDYNHKRIVLYKPTNSCERCYSRYHVTEFCNGPKRNKNYV